MKHRNSLTYFLYLLAFVLTLAMVVPAITTAQDNNEAGQEKESTDEQAAAGGWKLDAQGNVYIIDGKVGIGRKPQDAPQLQLSNNSGDETAVLLSGMKSSILLNEAKNYGFNITYDSSENLPGGASSALFGIWRRDGRGDPQPVITAYRDSGNVGIGIEPFKSTDEVPFNQTALRLAGNQLILGRDGFDQYGEEAYLYLGDPTQYIKAKHGTGIQIGTWHKPDAVTLRQETGYVGIGTDSPRAKLEISGSSGVAGLHLSLESNPGGANSPMVKWDSSAAQEGDTKDKVIWYARSEGRSWVLVSSNPDYDPDHLQYVIKANPDGEICIGSGC